MDLLRCIDLEKVAVKEDLKGLTKSIQYWCKENKEEQGEGMLMEAYYYHPCRYAWVDEEMHYIIAW